jgi:hypothetical protein
VSAGIAFSFTEMTGMNRGMSMSNARTSSDVAGERDQWMIAQALASVSQMPPLEFANRCGSRV